MSRPTQIELTKDEKDKFRELLRQHFPALETSAAMGGADTVEALCELYGLLGGNSRAVVIRNPQAPVLLTISSTDPDDAGEADLRQVVTSTATETAADRARRLAREEVGQRGELCDEDDPLDPTILGELQLSVTFNDVDVV